MALNLRELKASVSNAQKIITPRLTEWLLLDSDDALEAKIADTIRDLLVTKPRYRGASFGSSSAAYCWRAQVYAYLSAPQSQHPDPQLSNIFLDGKWRHLRWQAMLLSADILTDVEFPLPWPAMRSIGTMDGLGVVPDNHPNVSWRGLEFGFELKGVSPFQYGKHEVNGPLPKHYSQVARYFLSSGLPLFSIVYEDKGLQRFSEWVIEADSPVIKPYLEEQERELKALNEAVDKKRLPDRIPECQRLNGSTFKECPYGTRNGVCASQTRYPQKGTLK